MEDYRQAFKDSIFSIVETINSYELSDSAKRLVIHYFNESKASTSFDRAMEAITRYTPDKMPEEGERNQRLLKLLEQMNYYSKKWDLEN